MTRYIYPSGRVDFDDETGHEEAEVDLVHWIKGREHEHGVSVYQGNPTHKLGETMYGHSLGELNHNKLTAYINGLIGTSKFLAKWTS